MTRITIVGAGFAALTAVRRIRKKIRHAEITLVAPEPEFIYLPSLIWLPSGLRTADDLRIHLGHFLNKHGVRYHRGRATGLKDGGRTLVTDTGEVANDALIIASGGRFIKKLPGIEHALTICEGIPAAEAMRDRIKAMDGGTIALGFGGNPKEPSAMRGGPMFELLFGLDTQLRREGRRDKFELVFFSPAARPGQRMGAQAVEGVMRKMEKQGIKTRLGYKIKRFGANMVKTEVADIHADLILFMPGMTGAQWYQNCGLPLSPGGMLKADEQCRVPGAERVFVAGDAGSFPGPDWMPKQAHMADLQAIAAVDNLAAELLMRPSEATFKVELICIVDTLNTGILVYRDPRRSVVFPSFLFHWSKRFFEWLYLRPYRGPRQEPRDPASAQELA